MPIFTKKLNGAWSTSARKVFVKVGTVSNATWQAATRVFAKTTNGWVLVWPGNGPAVNTNDPINIRSGGYNGTVVPSPQYINAVLYGHDSNGASIVGDEPIEINYRKMKIASDDTGQVTRRELESTDIYNLTSNSETNVAEKRFYADGWWLFYEISATNVWATSILYSFPPIKIIRRIPIINSSTLTEDYSSPTLPTFNFNINISDLWYQAADWSRSYVRWWRNTSKTPGGTPLETEYLDEIFGYSDTRGAVSGGDPQNNYPEYNGSGTTYDADSVYVHNGAVPAGQYIIAELVLYNSYTDHYGTPVSTFKSTGDKPVIVSVIARDDNGNAVIDNQSPVRIMSDGYLNFTATVTGAAASDYYLLEPKFYNWQNGSYYNWDSFSVISSSSWPTDLTPDSVSLSGTTATVTWRIYIDADSLYAIGGPTYSGGQSRWELDFRISTRVSSSTSNASATYFIGLVDLGANESVSDLSSIEIGAMIDIAPSSAMTLNASSTSIQLGSTVTFSGTTVSYPSGYASYPRRYLINFGDGTNSGWNSFSTGTSNPSFSGITKTYNTQGTYTATLIWEPQGDLDRSTRSRTITVSPALSAPTSTSIVSMSRLTDTTVRAVISSSGGSGPYYQLWWVTSSTAPSSESRYDAASTTSTVTEDSSFSSGFTYYFYIRSSSENLGNTTTNGTGTAGTFSAYGPTTGAASYLFAHPSGSVSVSPSSGTAGTTQFTATPSISASPAANISYQWQYFEGGVFGWLAISGATSSTYTPPSNYVTLYGSNLRCLVTANNGVSSSTSVVSFETSSSVTVAAALTKLATPTGVNATDTRTDGVNVTWDTVSGAAYYGVWYGPAPSYDSLADFGGNRNTSLIVHPTNSYLDTSIGAGSSRNYYVQAYRSGDPTGTKSEWGGPDSGTRAVAGTGPSGGSVTLSPSGTQQAGTTITANVSAMSGTATISYTTTIRKKTGSSPTSNTDGTQVASGTGTGNVASHTITPTEASGTPDQFRAFTTGTNSFGDNTVASNTVISTPAVVTQYTISWNANGGSVSPTSNTVNSGTTVSAPTPTRSGYTFLYWRDSPNAFSYIYQINPGGSWTVTSNITFYAYWQAAAVAPSTPGTPTLTYVPANNTSTTWGYSASWGASTGSGTIQYQIDGLGSSGGSATLGLYSTNSATFSLSRNDNTWQIRVRATNNGGSTWSSYSGYSNSA